MLFQLLSGTLTFQTAIISILVILIIIFLILPFHEWAHAITAYALGDKAIKYRGRLTLNPLSHIDPFGALALLLFNFGWAKPVPVDSSNFKRPRLYMLITALMGPMANLVAAFVGGLIFFGIAPILPEGNFAHYFSMFMQLYISINVTLAVFNLIPIPPLDGGRILFAFLPAKAYIFLNKYGSYLFIIIFILLWTGLLSVPLNFLTSNILNFIYSVCSSIFGVKFI